jgi:hypothetical protein
MGPRAETALVDCRAGSGGEADSLPGVSDLPDGIDACGANDVFGLGRSTERSEVWVGDACGANDVFGLGRSTERSEV